MKVSAAAFAFLLSLSLCAQDFRLLTSHGYRLFSDPPSTNAVGLEVTEALFDGDSVFVLGTHWDQLPSVTGMPCFMPDVQSRFGVKVRLSDDGTAVIYSNDQNGITLLTQAEQGASWTAWENDTLSLICTLSAVDTEDVLGTPETVKTFTFETTDGSGNATDHYMNSAEYKVAEASGLIRAPALGNFPEAEWYSNYIYPQQGQNADLTGIGGAAGMQNITWTEVWDFSPGDELHYEEGNQNMGQTNLNLYKDLYLERSESGDTVHYEIQRTKWTYSGSTSGIDPVWQSTETVIESRHPDPAFDALSARPVMHPSGQGGGFNFQFETADGPVKSYVGHEYYYFEYYPEEDCYLEPINPGCPGFTTPAVYRQGLGGPYFTCQIGAASSSWRTLLHYIKDGTAWGNPILLNTTSFGDRGSVLLQIYPNPARTHVMTNLSVNSFPAEVHISDARGRPVTVRNISGNRLDISALSSGMYLLRVTAADGTVHVGKFVKQQ